MLKNVPLHDAWTIDLDGPPGRTVAHVRALLTRDRLSSASPAVRFLFALRRKLGSLFGWDRGPKADFQGVFESPAESIAEIKNATVHAFSVFALTERAGGYRLTWAIHVKPVGRLTGWYMAAIDPFRRTIIYPSILRHIRSNW